MRGEATISAGAAAGAGRDAVGPIRVLVVVLLASAVAGCRPEPVVSEVYVLAERGPEGLDPHLSGHVFQTRNVLANVYEGLVGFDPDMRLEPALAVSWSSPDDHTWEFVVRAGVRFHDGRELTPDDVAWSLERARSHPHSQVRGALAAVAAIELAPPAGVRLRLRAPDAMLPRRLREVAVLSRHFVETAGEAALSRASAGSGPYRLAAVRDGEVALQRFDAGWRPAPALARGTFLAHAWGEPALERRLPPGAAVLFWTRPGTDLYRRAEREARLVQWARPGIVYLGFDLRPAAAGAPPNPLLDVRVRRAIALAVDHDELLRAAVDDAGATATQLVAPFVHGYDPGLPPPRRDLAAARALLREAGHAEGLRLPIWSRELMPVYGAVLARQLGEAGLAIEPHVLDEAAYVERVSSANGGLYVLRFSCRTGDAQDFFDAWAHSPDPARGLGLSNYSFVASPFAGLDEQIRAARGDTAPASRLARLQALNRRLIEEQAAVPLLAPRGQVFVSPALRWTPRAEGYWLLRDLAPAS
jgi:peptide/nickel transport system substrate-binding protein